jgi:hypothetical protein
MKFRSRLVALLAATLLMGCDVSRQPPSATSTSLTSTSPSRSTTSSPSAPPPSTRGSPASFHVDRLVVRADPFRITTACPTTITFSGRISVAGGVGTVTYHWVRSDHAIAPVETVKFNGPGSQNVITTWTLGGPGFKYDGWEAIEIIRPAARRSERASFSLTCV